MKLEIAGLFIFLSVNCARTSVLDCPVGWTHFQGNKVDLGCIPEDPEALKETLQGTCPDGFIDSTLLNEDIGCLYFPDDSPTVWLQAENICDKLGTGGESVGNAGPGDAIVRRVEVTTLAQAKDLGTLAHIVQKDKKAWWLGASYVPSEFKWASDGSPVDLSVFGSIFTPNDPTPTTENTICVLMSYDTSVKWDDVDCWGSTYVSDPVGTICQCIGDLCPKAGITDPVVPEPPIVTDCLGDWLSVPTIGCVQILIASAGDSFSAASTSCSDAGGYLVEILTAEQLIELEKKEELFASIYGTSAQNFWLGMTDDILENVWYAPVAKQAIGNDIIPWYDGSAGGAKQPDGSTVENCLLATVGTAQGPGWHDVACDSTAFQGNDIVPICAQSASTTANPDCKYMTGDSTTCYLYVTEIADWTNAESNCVSQGGHLVSILSAEEDGFLSSSVIETKSVWIGGKGSGNGGFTWIDLSPWSYQNWKAGQPDLSDTEKCVFKSATAGTWHAYPCTIPLKYVCKLSV